MQACRFRWPGGRNAKPASGSALRRNLRSTPNRSPTDCKLIPDSYLLGVFFTPEADPLSLSGSGDWGQLDAQFISYRVAVSGGGTLTMAPNESMISLPPTSNALIR